MPANRPPVTLLAFAMTLLIALASCGSGAAGTQTARASSAPVEGAFRYVMDAQAAGDGERLWVYVTGRDGVEERELSQRLFERDRSGGWREIPPPPGQLGSQSQVFFAASSGRPCVATYRQNARTGSYGSDVACRHGSRWTPYAPEFPPLRDGTVEQLVDYRGAPSVVVRPTCSGRSCSSGRTIDASYRWDDGHWERLAPAVRSSGGIPTLTAQGSRLLLSVSETGIAPGAPRTVYELEDGRWRQQGPALVGRTIGPSISGPQLAGARTWIAVNEANRDPWRFSVFSREGADSRWRQYLGRPLNVGSGHAQGAIMSAGGALWATWSEERNKRGRFPLWERLFVARLDPSETTRLRPIELRSGLSIGPPPMQIVCGAGATWALYLATMRWGGYDARLRKLSSSCSPDA